MGADMTAYMYAYDDDTEQFEDVYVTRPDGEKAEVYYGRSYALFGLLANVRGIGDKMTRVKGRDPEAPEGVKTERDRFGNNAHSDTWYTLTELDNHLEYLKMLVDKARVELLTRLKYDKTMTIDAAEAILDGLQYVTEETDDIEGLSLKCAEYAEQYNVFNEFVTCVHNYSNTALGYTYIPNDNIRVAIWFDN